MNDATDPQSLEGKCLCGAVTIRAEPSQPHIEVCHCVMCRRWGGSASLGVQCGENVSFSGEEHITRFTSSEWAERGFCNTCGSNLFYHFTPSGGYSFAAGLFDDLHGITMGEQIFVDEKPDYYDFAQETPMKTGAEVIAAAKEAGLEF